MQHGKRAYLAVAVDAFHYTVPANLHIGQRQHGILQRLCRPEAVPAVNQIYLFTGSGQENGILNRHVSAAYHRYRLTPEKSAVTGGAVGNAHSAQFLFPGHAQMAVGSAGGYNNRPGLKIPFRCFHQLAILGILHAKHIRFHEFRLHFFRMLPELHPHVKTVDSGQPQIIVHLIGVEHLTSAHGIFLYYQRGKSGSSSVYRSTQPRRAGTDNYQIMHNHYPFTILYCKLIQPLFPLYRFRPQLSTFLRICYNRKTPSS